MVTTFGGDSSGSKMTSVDLQHYVNTRGLRDINVYSLKYQPIIHSKLEQEREHERMISMERKERIANERDRESGLPSPLSLSSSSGPTSLSPSPSPATAKRRGSLTEVATKQSQSGEIHPFVQELFETIRSSSLTMKNVDLLIEVERCCLVLGGTRVTFCKSGKDRTGMAVTLEQSRQLGERYGIGTEMARVLKDTNFMRVYGTRLAVAEKNIGRPVYAINLLQAKFLPVMFRPPASVCEDIMKKDNS
jgi:inositol polyphosphate-4-phosphatase